MNTPYRSTPYTPRVLKREKTTVSNSSSDTSKEPVRVFCRIRPLKSDTDASCISLVSPNVLSLNTPLDPKYATQKEIHCQFKQIFTSYATQREVFDYVSLPLLRDLLKGKNALLLSYGVTGSGKTFTLTGEPNNPGIMPRCIDTLFNTINDYQAPKFSIKPDRMNGFDIQSESDAVQDRLLENKTNAKNLRSKVSRKAIGDQMQYINEGVQLRNDLDENCLYAVFVSYVEIYNNTVFDLLDENNGKSLQSKILREDAQKNMYVNGVTEVEVKSAEEAFEYLNAGQKRKRMGHTLLNAESSRSHSVFNLKLVQIEQTAHNSQGVPIIPDSNVLRVSQLSLVDLAGSERTNRTQTTGMRLKEAGRINNSLMCLRNCLEILRENQLTGSNKLVPYRDSRLTFLFKNFFEGYGKVEMIVCVNPAIEDYEENLQVMKFAEMSQDVKIKKNEHRDTPYPKKTIRKIINTPSTTKIKSSASFTFSKIPVFSFNPEHFDDVTVKIQQISKLLKGRTTKVENYYQNFIKKDQHFRQRLSGFNKKQILTASEIKSIKALLKKEQQETSNLRSKINDLESVNDSLASKNDELQDVIRNLRFTIDEKDLKINQKILEKEKTKQKFALVNEKMTQELDNKLRKQREHLQATMKAKDEKLKKVKEILNSEDTMFIQNKIIEDTNCENETPKVLKETQTINRKNQTPASRNRRSRSAGEVWLEHNSIKPVALGTVLQPSFKKRKSLSKLTKASDITNPKQNKYCLIAQDQDTEGEIETMLYKGDILPTCGGGAQVIFNDVELLKQKSPTGSP